MNTTGSSGSPLLGLLLTLTLAPLALGQLYPMPKVKTNPPTPSFCVGCAGTNMFGEPNAGLPTYPFSRPVARHAGRFVDSQATGDFRAGFRTARARTIRAYPERNKIFIQIGNAAVSYRLDAFFAVTLSTPMVPVGQAAKTGRPIGGRNPQERVVKWDGFMYPEAREAKWFIDGSPDIQDPMGKGFAFDIDDRGYVYSTFPVFGWGIAKDEGGTAGDHFAKVVQLVTGGSAADQALFPNTRDAVGDAGESIIALKVGTRYYAVVAGQSNTANVFNVTDPGGPVHLAARSGTAFGIRRYDRSDATSRVAWVDGSKKLQIFSYNALIGNGAAVAVVMQPAPGSFADVAFDESGNLWAVEESARLWKLTPSGAGYIATSSSPFGDNFKEIKALTVGGDHVAVVGTHRPVPTAVRFDVRLARIEAAGPRLLELDNFFKNYYHGGLAGHPTPGQHAGPVDLQLVKHAGKTYLLYSDLGLGDVYEIESAPGGPGPGPGPDPPVCMCQCPCPPG